MHVFCHGRIGDAPIKMRVLSTDAERACGYQFEKDIPKPGEGLLFLFDEESSRHFHMNNVMFDLDLLGFDKNGHLVCFIPMKSGTQTLYKTPPVKYVVETSRGWLNGLKPERCALRVKKVV